MVKELYLSFENLDSALSELLDLVKKKKDALVSRNAEALNEVNKREESLINKINRLERKRIEILKNAAGVEEKMNGYDFDKFYSDLASTIPAEIMNSMNTLRNNVKQKAVKIREINHQNMMLINSSREYIKLLFQNLQGEKRSLVVNRKV